MCLKKEWYSTYKPYDGGSVLMGNNTVCKTVGIGNIHMRMFDGQVRTLTNIRHVPDLRKSLLSLWALEAQGCKFSGADGRIKLQRAPWHSQRRTDCKLIQDERKNYYWWCFSNNREEDTIRLWHMRLGHMSERGLQVLQKKSALSGIKYCKVDLCKFCIMDRQCRVAFFISQHKRKGFLDFIHADMWGSSPITSIGGY